MIEADILKRSLTYPAYKDLMKDLASRGLSTGHHQTQENLDFSWLNLQRMDRLDRTTVLETELVKLVKALHKRWHWLLLTEGWCGDCAQCIPVINAIASESEFIELHLLIRDDNPILMEQHLTKGSRSVPKLICMDATLKHEIFTWGPRPTPLQEHVMKMVNEGVSKAEKGLAVQRWYNADKTATIQREFKTLLEQYMN